MLKQNKIALARYARTAGVQSRRPEISRSIQSFCGVENLVVWGVVPIQNQKFTWALKRTGFPTCAVYWVFHMKNGPKFPPNQILSYCERQYKRFGMFEAKRLRERGASGEVVCPPPVSPVPLHNP